MRYLLTSFLAALLWTSTLPVSRSDKTGRSLTVLVTNIRNNKGQIGFCLFNAGAGFPDHPEKAMQRTFVPVTGNTAQYTFGDIPPGTYAVSVFHDENGDKKINRNFIGIPREGIGVSNNAKGRLGPPKFEDAKFNFSPDGQKITIRLNYL